jgi:hypothetical protein
MGERFFNTFEHSLIQLKLESWTLKKTKLLETKENHQHTNRKYLFNHNAAKNIRLVGQSL